MKLPHRASPSATAPPEKRTADDVDLSRRHRKPAGKQRQTEAEAQNKPPENIVRSSPPRALSLHSVHAHVFRGVKSVDGEQNIRDGLKVG